MFRIIRKADLDALRDAAEQARQQPTEATDNDTSGDLLTELTELTNTFGNITALFRTRGGAPVVLHEHRFVARFDHRGAPYAAKEPYERDGHQWRCLGCQAYGREDDSYNEPGYRRVIDARTEANEHAGNCWSSPLPTDHA